MTDDDLEQPPPTPVTPPTPPQPTEEDIAKAASATARRLARTGTSRTSKPGTSRRRRTSATYSDARDPAPLSSLMDQFVRDQGWQEQSAVARLMGDWAQVVGADMAGHVTPAGFEEGVLTLQAESTAWATQVRLLLPTLHRTINEALGTGVVTSITVLGPAAPSWVSGPRRVKGRGPRDTYG